jgi:hypothetical protein
MKSFWRLDFDKSTGDNLEVLYWGIVALPENKTFSLEFSPYYVNFHYGKKHV